MGRKRKEYIRLRDEFKEEVVCDYHSITIAQLCVRLETNAATGLTKEKAFQLYTNNGPNELTPCKKTPEIVKFIQSITHGFSILLWVGAVLCFIGVSLEYFISKTIDVENLFLGFVLVLITLLTGMFTYFQERKTNAVLDHFQNFIPVNVTVIRDGVQSQIDTKKVVIGDLVDLSFGDKVPADVRIISCQSLKVDNSSLTGEMEPVSRSVDCTSTNIVETKNVIFYSTSVVEGQARGKVLGGPESIVIMCGDNTILGRVAGLTARLQPVPSPIATELHKFMKFISIWASTIGLFFGITAYCLGYSWLDSALYIIGIIVSHVPEGLLATVTVSLTVTAKKMATKNCLVKNLEAVETLGSASVICSDKTGTLTQNRMTVSHLWYGSENIDADVSEAQEDAHIYKSAAGFLNLVRCATLCNRAEFMIGENSKPVMNREIRGDASESAILKFVEICQAHGPLVEYKNNHPKIYEIPFNSTNKYQVSIHNIDSKCVALMKGAPEKILEKCKTIYYNNATVRLTSELRNICNIVCMEFAVKGERVLGFCDLDLESYAINYPFAAEPTPNFPLEGYRFVGYISLVDPPRPQVPDAVDKCRKAGIKIIMITGDHPVTANALARQVGIISEIDAQIDPKEAPKSLVMDGNTLRTLSSKGLEDVLSSYEEIVFARTSPTQKLQIVEGLQRTGKIVAVTGDGVNDSPALKKADIGIAMGIAGSEVSKQSADMILLDDNFASIVVAVEEGRRIFDNLKKAVVYILASNVSEITPLFAFIWLNIPSPIGVMAILCIDVLTDMVPAISLANEHAEQDIMTRPPRNALVDHLVTFKLYLLACGYIGVIESMAGFFMYFVIMAEHGFQPLRLIGLRAEWDNYYINDLRDSYQQEWTYKERKILEYTCSTAFMMAVVVCQWADIIACKTRINSIVQQGMTNWLLNISLLVETALTCFFSYCPYMYYLKFYPLKLRWWAYALPFSIILLSFDEFRKWRIRKNKTGYFARETFY